MNVGAVEDSERDGGEGKLARVGWLDGGGGLG